MSQPDPDPFPQDALEANRSGRLTDAQRQTLRGMSGGYRKGELQFAAVLAVIGLLVWFAAGPAKYATVKPLLGIGFLIVAGFLVARSFVGADAVTRDLRDGRVEMAEGAIRKWTTTTHGSRGTSMTSYYVEVAGKRVETYRSRYEAAPEAGWVRIYYLPNSHRLVNLEHLPDKALPADALTDPRRAVKDALQGMRSHDPVQAAEAHAEFFAIGNAMKAEVAKAAAPPPPGERDPRPLSESILGAWNNGLMTVVFSGDGSVVATLPGGIKRSGRWSVDTSGLLRSDITGSSDPAEAWVSADHLRISVQGGGLTFQRVS